MKHTQMNIYFFLMWNHLMLPDNTQHDIAEQQSGDGLRPTCSNLPPLDFKKPYARPEEFPEVYFCVRDNWTFSKESLLENQL